MLQPSMNTTPDQRNVSHFFLVIYTTIESSSIYIYPSSYPTVQIPQTAANNFPHSYRVKRAIPFPFIYQDRDFFSMPGHRERRTERRRKARSRIHGGFTIHASTAKAEGEAVKRIQAADKRERVRGVRERSRVACFVDTMTGRHHASPRR